MEIDVIGKKLVTVIRDLARGYTDQELATERRIHHGEITPEDRTTFRLEESKRLFILSTGGGLDLTRTGLFEPQSPIAVRSMETYLKRVHQLNDLPDSDIDQLLVKQATSKLQSWHMLIKAPRIVNPPPPFMMN